MRYGTKLLRRSSSRRRRWFEIETVHDYLHDIDPLRHCPLSQISTSKPLLDWTDDSVAQHLTSHRDLTTGQGMKIHESVHGRKEIGRRRRRKSSKKGSLKRVKKEKNEIIQHRTSDTSLRHEKSLTNKLSQIPFVILASVLALHGATKTISAHRLSSICKIVSPTLDQLFHSSSSDQR